MTTPTHCLACQVPLLPGAGFCGTCGTPAGQRGATAQTRPGLPMPPAFHGGVAGSVMLPGATPSDLLNALSRAGATVTGASGNAVAFTATRSSKRTLGMKVRYRGFAEIAPGPSGAAATLRVRLDGSSMVPVLLIFGVVALFGLFLMSGGLVQGDAGNNFGVLLVPIVIALVVPYMMNSGGGARAMLATLTGAIGGGAPQHAPPAGVRGGMAPPPPAPAPVTPVGGIFDQLRELAALHEQGVLNVDEHNQARAALLAKIA